jgi:Zn finger protein HypA/HybF involved in hydrogenase expression
VGFVKCKICGKILKRSTNNNGYYSKHFIKHDVFDNFDEYLEPIELRCKVCNKPLSSKNSKYCSNECKFADMKGNKLNRVKNDKNKGMQCKLCGWISNDVNNLAGSLTKHLKTAHNIIEDKTILKDKYFTPIDLIDNNDKFICEICGWKCRDIDNKTGQITIHLKRVHNITVGEYIDTYGEFRKNLRIFDIYTDIERRNTMFENDDNFIECQICHKKFFKITNSHLKTHNITLDEYRCKYGKTTSNRSNKIISALTTKMNMNTTHKYTSIAENEIADYIKNELNVDIEIGNRKLLNGKELDIYIPSKKIAIEYNGLLWHSEFFGHKDKYYHLYKTEQCEKLGIQLIHIFEDEWKYKQNIVKARLKHIIGTSANRIYARKCEVKELNKKTEKKFLEQYHIQGSARAKVKLGLFNNGNLVAVMTFGDLRKQLGSTKQDNTYELIRFATKGAVVGGADKLFKYFIKTYNPTTIISYADRRWSMGKLYEVLGFNRVSTGKPNYWYMLGYENRLHRYIFRKSELKSFKHYNPNKTELEIMIEAGYDRIWDCGSLKYKWSSELINE